MKAAFAAIACLLAAGAAAPAAQDFPGLSLRDQREQDDSAGSPMKSPIRQAYAA
jgi:hypothetical protein